MYPLKHCYHTCVNLESLIRTVGESWRKRRPVYWEKTHTGGGGSVKLQTERAQLRFKLWNPHTSTQPTSFYEYFTSSIYLFASIIFTCSTFFVPYRALFWEPYFWEPYFWEQKLNPSLSVSTKHVYLLRTVPAPYLLASVMKFALWLLTLMADQWQGYLVWTKETSTSIPCNTNPSVSSSVFGWKLKSLGCP